MDIIDEAIQVVSQALRQGFFVPGLSLNKQAYQEFLSLCTLDYTTPIKPCKLHIVEGFHAERMKPLKVIQVQY